MTSQISNGNKNKRDMDVYRKMPWFEPYPVLDIYICPLNQEAYDLVDINQSMNDDFKKIYYRANNFYYLMQKQCLHKEQQQNTTVLTIGLVRYVFIIGIVTASGFFWQDEALFQLEKAYFQKQQQQQQPLLLVKNKMKFLDQQKNVVETPVTSRPKRSFQQKGFQNEIRDFFHILPWFKEKVNDIYICPLNEPSKMMIIEGDSLLDNEGQRYHRATAFYFDVAASSSRKKTGQSQTGHSTTYRHQGVEYTFVVGIITQHGLFKQDVDIFEAQIDYLNNWKRNIRTKEIETILTGTVDVEKYGGYFKSFASTHLDMEGDYIDRVLNVYLQHYHDGRTFIEEMSRLVIFLNPKLSIIRESNFVKRFKKMHYNAEILPFLKEYDKLAEVYSDAKTPEKTLQNVSAQLHQQWVETRNEWINSLLLQASSKMKYARTKMGMTKMKFVQLPSWKTVCKNAAHLVDVEEEDVVYVKDASGDIYGFSIAQMFDLIENQNGINPYTRLPLEKKVLERFLDTYTRPPVKTEDTPPVELDEGIEADVNQLVLLLENHLCYYEGQCMQCRNVKSKESFTIETYEKDFPILKFCSQECMSTHAIEEFRAVQI